MKSNIIQVVVLLFLDFELSTRMVDEYHIVSSRQPVLASPALLETDRLSYEEYFKRIEEMTSELKNCWHQEQRVNALKMAIQLSKLLADTSQMKLYSRKYRLIIETLKEFGQLIYDRIQSKADKGEATSSSSDLADDRTSTNKELAKETCRNWFLKVASIRELVPRFYTELTILKICDFLLKPTTLGVLIPEEQFYFQSLKRLTMAAWGFGDPIVALHARLYLCRVAKDLINWDEISNDNKLYDLIYMNLNDSATLIGKLDAISVTKILKAQNVDSVIFFELISGAVQSILNIVSHRNDLYTTEETDQLSETAEVKFEELYKCLMSRVEDQECSTMARDILVYSVARALPPDIIANHSEEILSIIETTFELCRMKVAERDVQCTSSTLYLSMEGFAQALDSSEKFDLNANSQMKESILKSIETILNELPMQVQSNGERDSGLSPNYLRCIKAWYSYANHYVDHKIVDAFLARILVNLKKERRYVSHYPTLLDLIRISVSHRKTVDDFRELFGTKSLSHLFELLHRDDIKLEASKWILETMRSNLRLNNQEEGDEVVKICDKISISFITNLFSFINDSLSLLAADDDFEHLSNLVIYYLDRITILDFKELLDFLSRCRSLVGNLNLVLEYLAKRVLKLAIRFRDHERKRSQRHDYLNGCLAFAFVTAPAINNLSSQLNLYIEGSRLALSQMSLSLADYYLKQAFINVNEQLNLQQKQRQILLQDNISGMESVVGGGTRNEATLEISKQFFNQVEVLTDLVLKYQDHVDLKHKLVLTNVIKISFCKHSGLIECIKCLNVLDADDNNVNI